MEGNLEFSAWFCWTFDISPAGKKHESHSWSFSPRKKNKSTLRFCLLKTKMGLLHQPTICQVRASQHAGRGNIFRLLFTSAHLCRKWWYWVGTHWAWWLSVYNRTVFLNNKISPESFFTPEFLWAPRVSICTYFSVLRRWLPSLSVYVYWKPCLPIALSCSIWCCRGFWLSLFP